MKNISIAILFLAPLAMTAQPKVHPPQCKKIPKTDTLHGKVLIDPYYWLRDRKNPEVIRYIENENIYTAKMMESTQDFQTQLYNEIVARIKQTDESVPYKMRGYWYYTRTEEGENYSIYCRKKDTIANAEEVLLNVNDIIRQYRFYGIYGHEISPDNQLMAYFVDKTGNYETDVYFMDLQTKTPVYDTLRAVTSLVWANDNKTLLYSTQDPVTNRSYKVYKHVLGNPSVTDELLYHERDSLYDVDLHKSKSDEFIFLNSSSAEQTEVRYLNANMPNTDFRIIHPREKGHIYEVSHFDDKFYILTDKDALNFKLVKTDTASPAPPNWQEVIPHRQDVMIEEIEIFKDYLVLTENHQGLYKIRVINWSSGDEHYIPFAEETYDAYPTVNLEFDTHILNYAFVSLKTPPSVFAYHMKTREQKLVKQKEVLGGYDPDRYVSKRLWAEAADGKKVPISLVYKEGLQKNGNNPVFIEGYGAYGASYYPYFDSDRFNLIDRGFIYAIAHVRGGSDLGRQWYEDGKLLKKKNTFTDFITCLEHLIEEKYTSKGLVVARGASAGGLLAGAVVNSRPDLFKAVILDVPFVDVVNTMLDTSMPLTTQEYEEWGNPQLPEYFDYIYSYSPYDNVSKKDYPHMLFLTGMTDEQVSYWEPVKMVARLRDLKTDDNKLLLKVEMSSGHSGASGRYNYYKEVAFEQAFVLTLFDIRK